MCGMLHWTVHQRGVLNRYYHAAVAVRHKVYSFGGKCNVKSVTVTDKIDVHVFNTVSLCWTTLQGRGLASDVPSMRYGHTAVVVDDHMVYIWGGATYRRAFSSNRVYTFDVEAHHWFRPEASGAAPETRYKHSACALGRVMYVYGGYNQLSQRTNDIYKLDTAAMAWSVVDTRGGALAPVSECHSATIIGTKMIAFGGRRDFTNYNGVSVFDTETDRWLDVAAAPRSAQLFPEGREDHSAFAYNGELYIFGGDNFARLDWLLDDLWKFNPETFSWTKMEPKGKGHGMTSMCCCVVGERVVLFGGYRYTPDDLYILDLSPTLKTLCKLAVIHHGLEQLGLPHDIRWELTAMTTNVNRSSTSSGHGFYRWKYS